MSVWDEGNDNTFGGKAWCRGYEEAKEEVRVVIYMLNVRCFLSIKEWMPSRSLDVSLELKGELRDRDNNLEEHQFI